MRMEMIRLEHVTKSFGRYKALDDVSIVVEEGEFLTVIGRSGCGKTTMLRMINGLQKPDSGRGRRRRGGFDPASKKDRLCDTK